jgi:hypothetical protein
VGDSQYFLIFLALGFNNLQARQTVIQSGVRYSRLVSRLSANGSAESETRMSRDPVIIIGTFLIL